MQVPLSQGKVAVVDPEDAERVNQYKWHAYRDHNSWYVQAHDSEGRSIYLHRVIIGAIKGEKVDHIDGDGLNNRRDNLRKVTHAQNMRNRRSVVGKSQYKGVTRSANPKKWRARICVDRTEIHLGSFGTETDAALAYDTAAKQHFGEFACLNFP